MMMRTGGTEAGREKLSETIQTVGSLVHSPQHTLHYSLLTPSTNSSVRLREFLWKFLLCSGAVRVLFRIYIEYFHNVLSSEVVQLQNYMMKQRHTVIHLFLSHLFLFIMQWKVFFIQSTSLHLLYFRNKNVKFWPFLAFTQICYMFRLKLN